MGDTKPLLGKIVIRGTLEVLTGLHIGASRENIDIGGIDSPVIRDPLTREPYIPGSSLKGKFRSLLERARKMQFNRSGGRGVRRHECDNGQSACEVCRLFGSTGRGGGENHPARLTVRDARLTPEAKELLSSIDTGLQYTEWKFENAIDRITSAANPRQLERIPAGSTFAFELVYDVEAGREQVAQDLTNLLETMGLLEDDALGGHGSRGYGKVRFRVAQALGRKVEAYSGDASAQLEFRDLAVDTLAPRLGEIVGLFA